MENMKIEVWSNKLNKMVQFETQQELEDSPEFSDWVDEQIEKLYMENKIDPYAVEEFLRGYFAMHLWELNGNGGNILYPNLKNPADLCWADFKRDCCIEQDILYIKSAPSGTSDEEIAKAVILYKMDGYTDDDRILMEFDDDDDIKSVYMGTMEYYELYDGNPNRKPICNNCGCEFEPKPKVNNDWKLSDEQVNEILKDYCIYFMK